MSNGERYRSSGEEGRETRRQRERFARRFARARGKARRGQSMVIFALTLTALIAMLGLAIDTVRIYDLYARLERAAEAGALAGVIYMPNNYAAAYASPGDGKSAVSRAREEVVKNGFGKPAASPTFKDCPNPPNPGQVTVCSACPNPPTSIEVAVCPVPGKPTDLDVTITESISVLFLGAIGVGPTRISASAQAEYLPPAGLGGRAVTQGIGDTVECSTGNSLNTNSYPCLPSDPSNHLQAFTATINGPAELKQAGDPMVYCAEGPTEINSTNPNSAVYTYNGYPTDHAQWSGITGSTTTAQAITQHCGVPSPNISGNPDYQPSGYTGEATKSSPNHPGGYNYQVMVTPGITGSLWAFNPYYTPQDTRSPLCQAPQSTLGPYAYDRFLDQGINDGEVANPNYYSGPIGEGIGLKYDGIHHDSPLFYFNTTISLYQVNSQFDRSTDALKGSWTYPPYDCTSADLTAHGCTAGQVYNPYVDGATTPNTYYNPSSIVPGHGCVSLSQVWAGQLCFDGWCKIPISGGLLGAGMSGSTGVYRLVVEATGLPALTSAYQSSLTDGYGTHSYGLKICDKDLTSTPVGCGNANGAGQYNTPDVALYAWNNLDMTFMGQLITRNPNKQYPQTSCVVTSAVPYACMDLACLPTIYAGRTVTLTIFNPGGGSGSGSEYLSVVSASGGNGTVTYPSWVTTKAIDGDTAVVIATNEYRPYRGLKLDVTIKLAANYTGTCGTNNDTGWWQLMYAANTNFQPFNTMGLIFSLTGSPLHLTTLG